MKTLFIIQIIILFISCGYRKDKQIMRGIYMVRVWPPLGLTNSGAQMIYYLPMEGITDHKVYSINKLADEYIEKCEKYN